MRGIEVMGRVNSQGNLSLDQPLQLQPKRVRVIILIADEDEDEQLEPAIEGFRQGWQDAMTGNTVSVDQL
jgi:hypothetical protein